MELGAEGASVRYTPSRQARQASGTALASERQQGCPPSAAATAVATAVVVAGDDMAVVAGEPAEQVSTACPPGFRALKRDDLDTAWSKYQPPKRR